jgi:hypothetical protein
MGPYGFLELLRGEALMLTSKLNAIRRTCGIIDSATDHFALSYSGYRKATSKRIYHQTLLNACLHDGIFHRTPNGIFHGTHQVPRKVRYFFL